MKNRYGLLFVPIIAAALLINGAIWYFYCGSREYIYSDGQPVKVSTARAGDELLSAYSSGAYASVLKSFSEERDGLDEYLEALDLLNNRKITYIGMIRKKEAEETVNRYGNISEDMAKRRLEQLSYCIGRLEYALGYRGYILGISRASQRMQQVSIFGSDAKNRIIKTSRSYSGLENIAVSAELGGGVNVLFSDRASDIIAASAAVICGILYFLRCTSAVSERPMPAAFAAVLAAGIFALYCSNILTAETAVGLGDLSRPIQSVNDFMSCPYLFSAGTFIFLRICFKTAACLTVYFMCTALLSSDRKRLTVPLAALFFGLQAVLCARGGKLAFFTEFVPERIFATYDTDTAFGITVGSAALFCIMTALLFAAAAYLSYRGISAVFLAAREKSEREYFDDINAKFAEARLIRHDIGNHLAAVASLLDEGRAEEARKYLGEISEELERTRPAVKTGSAVLDALLFRKISDGAKRDVKITADFSADLSRCGISDYDLCGLFSNILDNAVEAAESCGNGSSDERKVLLNVKKQMDMLCVFCENGYSEICRSDSGFSTLKPDKNSHGLGLKRIRRIAEKYGGTVDVSAENGVFTLSALLNTRDTDL